MQVRKQNGGQWRPPSGFFPPGMGRSGPPSSQHGLGTGMPAPPGPPQVPPMAAAGIAPPGKQRENSPPIENDDLETRTARAEAEWKEIVAVYDAFEKALGPGYNPLSADSAPPIATPFGPALQYRTHTIACVWSLFYTGRIILERAHPSMPPEAMVAAGICAFRTGQFANSIGRIVAGIYYPQQFDENTASLIPSLSAAYNIPTPPNVVDDC
ncbi:predicted protein [Histoplasma mississippiense (nom. inval.)]|uniref:predicted protein n=1 Tax=Ajellomyces capsulatus (strain NAm1 / WU24) TaxID=2059318 RepID=UPI000157CDDB|nr:predicted protein [Histoplasma mississippiense (nom. inval.)]EDN10654.1 predicted protein [Histoplasma mississippiense (nom. inval.)]